MSARQMKGGVGVEMPVMGLVLILSGISDLKEYKIRNVVVVMGWVSGTILHLYHNGISGMFRCVSCILGIIFVCIPLYKIGGIGAGDIKLFSVVGGLHGFLFAWRVGVLFVILSGVCSLCKLLKMRLLRVRIAKMYYLFRFSPKAVFSYYLDKKGKEEFVIPLAPILAVAYFIVCFAERGGILGVN